MKIVLIGTTAWTMIEFRGSLIKTLSLLGHEVYGFAIDFDENTCNKLRQLGGVPVKYNFSRAGLNPIPDIINTFRLAKKIKEICPDIVFSFFVKPLVFGTIAALLAGVNRRIGMLEGLGYAFTEHPNGQSFIIYLIRQLQLFLYWLSFPLLERLILLNPDDYFDLVKKHYLPIKKVSILGGIGVSLEDYPYSEAKSHPICFLFVGRLIAEKGIHDFISSAKIVSQSHADVKFVVLGGLDDSNPGSLTANDLNTYVDSGLIEYPGHVDNVIDWITDSSVFVLPSYYREGVPKSIQEALAVGRAIITTDSPGCRETVIDGVNGFLVPRWSPDKLAEVMNYFIVNKELIKTMGNESYKIAVEKFDAKKVNAKLIRLLLGN